MSRDRPLGADDPPLSVVPASGAGSRCAAEALAAGGSGVERRWGACFVLAIRAAIA
jgi:hypothetical protein